MTKLPFLTLSLAVFAGTAAAAIPTGVTCAPMFETSGANRFTLPTWMGEIPNKPGNFIVLEQAGTISVLAKGAGTYTKSTFLTIPVRTGRNEMGLVGFAFHPQFASNRKYYVHYHPPVASGEVTVIDERTADATFMKDSGDPARNLITADRAGAYGHAGGGMNFGPDGFLYIGLGDAEAYREPQRKTSFWGKILRIDPDKPADGKGYGIPSDNPFVSDADATVKKEIFAYGLRNPFRFSFDPSNGDLWAGDVGWNAREEIDVVRKGANYGWSDVEGDVCGYLTGCDPNKPEFSKPIAIVTDRAYDCIIGGHVYRGDATSQFYGTYIHADYDSRTLWGLTHNNYTKTEHTRIGQCPSQISSMGTDGVGNLYVVGHVLGIIYKLSHPELREGPVPIKDRAKLPRVFKGRKGSALAPWIRDFRHGTGPLEIYRNDGTRVLSLGQGMDFDAEWAQHAGTGLYLMRAGKGGDAMTGSFLIEGPQ